MKIVPGKNLALWTSVLKQEPYLSYVRTEIKTPIFKNPIKKSKFNLN